MLKIILPLYLICIVLYIFFTRQPDYQDGEFTAAVIHFTKDSLKQKIPTAFYRIDNLHYKIDASYALRKLKENEQVTIIYDTSDPRKAALYMWWGYWLQWKEIAGSFIGIVILYYAAASIVGNPAEEKK